MTTTDIKNLIASKIAGQGSAVDAGSALPEILNGIVEALENMPSIPDGFIYDVTGLSRGDTLTRDQVLSINKAMFLKWDNALYPLINAQNTDLLTLINNEYNLTPDILFGTYSFDSGEIYSCEVLGYARTGSGSNWEFILLDY